MKKAKALLAAVLAVSVIFLCGCSNISDILNKNNSGYYEITAVSKNASNYASVDICEDNVVFITYKGTDGYLLSVYNAENNRISASVSLDDCGLEHAANAKFKNENEIVIYDDFAEKAVSYDLNLNKTGETDYTPDSDMENVPQSELLTNDFDYKDEYAVRYSANKTTCVFYDETDKFYINDNDSSNFIDTHNKSVLKSVCSEKDNIFTVGVDNYKDGVRINEIKFNKQNGLSDNIQLGKLNDKYAVFILETTNDFTGGIVSTPYIWKYQDNPANEKLELSVKSEKDITDDNNSIIGDIKDSYNIRITCDEVIEGFYENETEYGVNALELNTVLTGISRYLKLFPDGFVKEIYDYDPYFSGLKINIVKSIENINAYAIDNMGDHMLIVFSYYGFGDNAGVFFHEFMHLIDGRISDYYLKNYNSDFYDEWCRLNPKDFEYANRDAREPEFEYNESYFISDYATTDMLEDAADTFRYLCENAENGVKNDYEGNLNKKIELLCKAIRAAYPSAAKEAELYWEKPLNK